MRIAAASARRAMFRTPSICCPSSGRAGLAMRPVEAVGIPVQVSAHRHEVHRQHGARPSRPARPDDGQQIEGVRNMARRALAAAMRMARISARQPLGYSVDSPSSIGAGGRYRPADLQGGCTSPHVNLDAVGLGQRPDYRHFGLVDRGGNEARGDSAHRPLLALPLVHEIGVDAMRQRNRRHRGPRLLTRAQHALLDLYAVTPPTLLDLFHGIHLSIRWIPSLPAKFFGSR